MSIQLKPFCWDRMSLIAGTAGQYEPSRALMILKQETSFRGRVGNRVLRDFRGGRMQLKELQPLVEIKEEPEIILRLRKLLESNAQ